jgi:glucose/arabinose dehydrogenase
MSFNRMLLLSPLGVLALSIAVAGQAPPPPASPGVALPAGDGRDALINGCNRCHLVTTVLGRQRTREEWSAVVADMRARGAIVNEGEAAGIVTYLSTHFAPGSPTPAAGQGPRGGVFVLSGRVPDTPPVIGQLLETRSAVGAGQTPAFAGQTRAVAVRTAMPISTTVVTNALRHPWALAFLPDGRMLVTEKPGAMRIVTNSGSVGTPLAGVPAVSYGGDGGLLDVVLDPAFRSNRQIFFTFVEPRGGGNGLSLARARLRDDDAALDNVTILLRVEPARPMPAHYGSRLLFDRDGKLLMTVGERFEPALRIQAQQLDSRLGKALRLNPDGSPAPGNPFASTAKALAEIWSYGHRNSQGLAFHPTSGALWSIEHGPAGGDEINIVKPGLNYGWPLIAYGTEYDLRPINGGRTAAPGMEQPIYYWDPAIGPTSMAFYSGDLIAEWKGNLFVASHNGQHIARLVLEGERVVGEERLLLDQRQMMRWVGQGPDGALWVLTDNAEGRLIRLAPESASRQSDVHQSKEKP